MTMRDRILEQIEQVDADLDDLDAEVAAGELDLATADELRATYRTEHHRLQAELATLQDEPETGPDRRRVFWGVGLTAGVLAVITIFMLTVVDDRAPGELATGGITNEVVTGGVDLDSVTNDEMEAVIADNPNVVGMRMALARRYFQQGAFSEALGHYLVVLEQQPSNPEALANVGWMSFLSQEAEIAASYVERALESAPGYPDALWYLGNIRLFGLDDPAGAVEPLEQLLAVDGLPEEVRTEAQSLLEQARSG